MFDSLTDKLGQVFKKLRGHGKITESNITEALREVRIALLEADVHLKVVKEFLDKVKEKALGQEVLNSVTPAQQFIKIVADELVNVLGSQTSELDFSGKPPVVIMLVGLQGSGKTTQAAKLALFLRNKKRKPGLVCLDIYRPAAYDQLKKLAGQISVPFFEYDKPKDPLNIAKESLIFADKQGLDTLIFDTAGRLHIDQELMDELKTLRNNIKINEVLLVVDSMIGQEALNVAEKFNQEIKLTGLVLTKLDGDARGGAALSAKIVTGVPIKFAGIGEKLNALEVFHPDRMASRILGMGDVISYVEKVQEVVEKEKAIEWQQKLKKGSFTLEDFREQFKYLKKMGSIESIMSFIPGMNKLKKEIDWDKIEKDFKRMNAIIDSMTLKERRNPDIINGSRKRRIAMGSGTTVQEVNTLLKNYFEAKRIFTQIKKKGEKNFLRGIGGLFK
ncbi:MAG: signal recognition particle protein [Proteobacteria bacterium]|nr:signal recognition particle protein [Pseudomonadota bacterium]